MRTKLCKTFCSLITLAFIATVVIGLNCAHAESMKTAQLTQVNNIMGLVVPKSSNNLLVNLFPGRTPTVCRIIGNNDPEKDFFIPLRSLDDWQNFLDKTPNNFVVSGCSGTCGTANGKSFKNFEAIEALPKDALCQSGLASTISGEDSSKWECAGIDGAVGASCEAYTECKSYNSEILPKNDACPAGFVGTVSYQKNYYCPSGHEPGVWDNPKVVSTNCKYNGDNAADVCGDTACKITSAIINGESVYITSISGAAMNAVNNAFASLTPDNRGSFESYAKAVDAGIKDFLKNPAKWKATLNSADYEDYVPEGQN